MVLKQKTLGCVTAFIIRTKTNMATEEVILCQMAHAYPYQPLREHDSIRLLLLHPISTGQSIECSLIHTRLSHCETDVIDHYTALSYVWGDASNTEVILVDSSPVTITANLHNALLSIRDSSRTIRLWVDAVCINQQNDGEKSIQVGMMSKIYSTAHHTIIYLGSIEPHIVSAITFGDPMPQLVLEYILSKEWFTRDWVFQELVLSKDPWLQLAGHCWKWDYIYACLQKTAEGTSSTNIFGKD